MKQANEITDKNKPMTMTPEEIFHLKRAALIIADFAKILKDQAVAHDTLLIAKTLIKAVAIFEKKGAH